MTLAYATSRALARRCDEPQARRITRHAVDDNSYACGALDTICGRRGAVGVGEWTPGHPDNCHKCTRLLAGEEEAA